jgi:hypothetical protein
LRLYNWQSRLAEVIKQKQRGAFEWGVNDCCLFVCDAILAVTGVDPGLPFRSAYKTPLEGARLVKEYCGGAIPELAEAMALKFSYPEVESAFIHRGDLGLYLDPVEGPTLGINIGRNFTFLTEQGLVYVPNSMMARCWSIG